MVLFSGILITCSENFASAAPLTTAETLNLSYDGIEKIRIGIESISHRQRLNRRLIIVCLVVLLISTVLIIRRLKRIERHIKSNPLAKETIDYVEKSKMSRSSSDSAGVMRKGSEGELKLADDEKIDNAAEFSKESELTDDLYIDKPEKKIFGVGLKTIIKSQLLIAFAAGLAVILSLLYF